MEITNWRKSTRSTDHTYDWPNCVEVGWTAEVVGYRDSKATNTPPLLFPKETAHRFVHMITT